jgi:hypothetical protein
MNRRIGSSYALGLISTFQRISVFAQHMSAFVSKVNMAIAANVNKERLQLGCLAKVTIHCRNVRHLGDS